MDARNIGGIALDNKKRDVTLKWLKKHMVFIVLIFAALISVMIYGAIIHNIYIILINIVIGFAVIFILQKKLKAYIKNQQQTK